MPRTPPTSGRCSSITSSSALELPHTHLEHLEGRGSDADRPMTTYVVIRNGALIEKHLAGPLAACRSAQVISDIAPFQTQDGTAITSRAALCDCER
jgi:hypothetical protein